MLKNNIFLLDLLEKIANIGDRLLLEHRVPIIREAFLLRTQQIVFLLQLSNATILLLQV